jgi:hypothetical protein
LRQIQLIQVGHNALASLCKSMVAKFLSVWLTQVHRFDVWADEAPKNPPKYSALKYALEVSEERDIPARAGTITPPESH